MAHSSDTPILPALVPAGDDLLMALDVSTNPATASKIRLNQISGLSPEDVIVSAAGSPTVRRLTFINSGTTSTLNIPAPSGAVREIIVMNGGSGAATVTSAAANIRGFITGTQAAATTNSVAAFTAATFLSDGTTWYRVR